MSKISRKFVRIEMKWRLVLKRVSIFRQFFRFLCDRVLICSSSLSGGVIKSVGSDEEKRCLNMSGLNLVDKIFSVKGARIAFSIWDVGGDYESKNHVPIACKDAVAILSCLILLVTAIPVLIGTKFDDFVQLPLAMQWTIVSQARTYAQAMQATLFFSSSTHNININKVFKFITAKLFNLPWTVERNLNVGEPIIDF
ncbi:hypothetical protein MKW92_014754 [Papaver armeniacum]|nr:hypothetical protein MKW92_014754 [Papaver armeniacum]